MRLGGGFLLLVWGALCALGVYWYFDHVMSARHADAAQVYTERRPNIAEGTVIDRLSALRGMAEANGPVPSSSSVRRLMDDAIAELQTCKAVDE